MPIYVDNGLEGFSNFIVGANEDAFHLKNVNFERDFKPTKIADLRMAKAGDKCPSGKGTLQAFRGIEVGHVFYLGTKYSKMMAANFLDKEGQSKPIEMGCYGIGVTRTVQATIEQSHDQDGIIWPKHIAPFAVHICLLDVNDSKISGYADEVYQTLSKQGLDVLLDDRDERPGVKFKDADLLGMPIRLVIGKKGLDSGVVEVVVRKTKEMHKVAVADLPSFVKNLWEKL
jgi:prolyl-tRNA synthetase